MAPSRGQSLLLAKGEAPVGSDRQNMPVQPGRIFFMWYSATVDDDFDDEAAASRGCSVAIVLGVLDCFCPISSVFRCATIFLLRLFSSYKACWRLCRVAGFIRSTIPQRLPGTAIYLFLFYRTLW